MVTSAEHFDMAALEARRPGSAPPFLSKRECSGLSTYLRPAHQVRSETVKARKSIDEALAWDVEQEQTDITDTQRSKSEQGLSKHSEVSKGDHTLKMQTRNFSGIVSQTSFRSHLNYFIQRKAGRDTYCGFRTPFGEDYAAVGGDVSVLPGDVIKKNLLPEGFVPRIKAPAPEKHLLNLDVTVERMSQSFKFAYFEIDLTERPLHSNPSRTLHVQWTITAGDVEIYFAMSDNHAFPEKQACDWAGDPNSSELIVYPSDPIYRKAKSKKITIAIRGQMGYLEYKLRAETQAFLSKLEKIFQERATTKAQEDKKRDTDMTNIQSAIKNSQMRSTRARSGLKTPEKGFRPVSQDVENTKTAENKVDTEEVDDGTVDLDDLDDIPLRADHYHAFKSQPLPQFLQTVLGNLEKEALRLDRYRGSTSPFALRLDKLVKPAVVVQAQASHRVQDAGAMNQNIGGKSFAKPHDMPLPSARGHMVSARGLPSARQGISHIQQDHSREPDKAMTSARGLGSARGVPESARDPPEFSRNRAALESARTDGTEDNGMVSGRSARSSARTVNSEQSNSGSMLKGVHRDEARLYGSIFKFYRKEYLVNLQDKDEKGKSSNTTQKEIGVNVPRFHELLKDMKILGNSALDRAPSKRDLNLICREIFRLRKSEKHPSDDDIVLTEAELRIALEQVGKDFFEKPIYLVGSKPDPVDKKVWERLRDESNPQKRLQKIAAHPDFKRKILRAFGRWDKDSDGKLSKEEFVLLCAKEIGLQREDSIGMLQKAGVHRREAVRLNKFVQILFPESDEHGENDERDTAAARESKLGIHLLTHHLKELTSTVSVDNLNKERANISLLQDQMQISSGREPEVLKEGWLESRDPKSIITNWRKCYCVVEKLPGGGIVRLYDQEFKATENEGKGIEPLETLYLDGRNPVELVGSVIQGEESSEVVVDSKKPCVFKVFCKKNSVAARAAAPKRKVARKRKPGNLSSRSENSVMSEDADGWKSARSGASSARSEVTNRSHLESRSGPGSQQTSQTFNSAAKSQKDVEDFQMLKPIWNQSGGESNELGVSFIVQFRICGYHSQEKGQEWKDAMCSAVNELELQTNRVLQELGSLLKSASSKPSSNSTAPISAVKRKGSAKPDLEAESAAENEAAERIKDILRSLLQPASIITPAYDGAGNITLQGLQVKDDPSDGSGAEGWDGSGKKGKNGKGRAVHRLPTIAEESDADAVWD